MPSRLIEFDYLITPDSLIYDLNDMGHRFLIGAVGGLGMPPIEYLTLRGPAQHGETIRDYRLNPRTIQMVHRRDAFDRYDYWDMRSDLINHLRPNRGTSGFELLTLRKILPDWQIRDIEVRLERGAIFPPNDLDVWDEWAIVEAFTFVAPDPTFFDPAEVTVTAALVITGELKYPAAYPVAYGGAVIDVTENITYLGNWLSLPIIEIDGPITNPKIENLDTGEEIELTYTLPIGRTITIDLSYDAKTIEDDLGTNLIGTRTTASDLGTFHLAPDPEVADGLNRIQMTGDLAEVTTEFRFRYFTRYIGI